MIDSKNAKKKFLTHTHTEKREDNNKSYYCCQKIIYFYKFKKINGDIISHQLIGTERTKTFSQVVSEKVTTRNVGLTSAILRNHSIQAPQGEMGFNV